MNSQDKEEFIKFCIENSPTNIEFFQGDEMVKISITYGKNKDEPPPLGQCIRSCSGFSFIIINNNALDRYPAHEAYDTFFHEETHHKFGAMYNSSKLLLLLAFFFDRSMYFEETICRLVAFYKSRKY